MIGRETKGCVVRFSYKTQGGKLYELRKKSTSIKKDDAITHVRNWAQQLKIDNPHIIGWDFPNISQEQSNVFHMHGYSAALVLDKDQEIGDIDANIVTQEKQKYITITIHGPSESPFVLIPNAYKALLTHMKTNGIREKRDSSVLACYEYEYVDAAGIDCMDIFIAIE